MPFRTESDLLGDIQVPADALFGAQTQRAVLNFPIGSGRALGSYAPLVDGLLLVKIAAARVNGRCGFLPEDVGAAIEESARAVIDGRLYQHFPIHALHGGGGTSANMNANEVLANMANERLGGKRGVYSRVHPNDHVNKNQSTNDVYPTACRIALIRQWPRLEFALQALGSAFTAQAVALKGVPRLARTCLQDAVEIGFDDLLGGYAEMLHRNRARIGGAIDALHAVNLGGTIVGRAGDVPAEYFAAIIPALRESTGDAKYSRAGNLFDAAQNLDDAIAVSSTVELLARSVIKVAKDLRLMSSGPEGGFGEIRLPAVQAGSSIMPGKVNPVIPEFAVQLCLQAIGCHAAARCACDHGELDLNIWESVVVCNTLDAMELLENATRALAGCVAGMEVVIEKNQQNVHAMMPLLTRLMQKHGYSTVSEVCKKAGGDLMKLRAMLKEKGWA